MDFVSTRPVYDVVPRLVFHFQNLENLSGKLETRHQLRSIFHAVSNEEREKEKHHVLFFQSTITRRDRMLGKLQSLEFIAQLSRQTADIITTNYYYLYLDEVECGFSSKIYAQNFISEWINKSRRIRKQTKRNIRLFRIFPYRDTSPPIIFLIPLRILISFVISFSIYPLLYFFHNYKREFY